MKHAGGARSLRSVVNGKGPARSYPVRRRTGVSARSAPRAGGSAVRGRHGAHRDGGGGRNRDALDVRDLGGGRRVSDTARRVPLRALLLAPVVVLHDGAEAHEAGGAAAVAADEEDLAGTAAAARVAGIGPAADVALALAKLVAAELVEFVEAEILCLVAELEECFETGSGLRVATAEGRSAGKSRGCGRRAEVV